MYVEYEIPFQPIVQLHPPFSYYRKCIPPMNLYSFFARMRVFYSDLTHLANASAILALLDDDVNERYSFG